MIGVFLLVPVALLAQTFFSSFARVAVNNAFWATEEFWFFSLGAVLWVLAFFGGIWASGEPRLLRVYVFGHELTHAIWVWVMGGQVSEFKVTREGGFIMTDTHNVWVALSPYFYPVYSVGVIVVYGLLSAFYDVSPYTSHLFACIGFTWAFHLCFALWMIPKGQSDLTQFGTFYSLVIIAGMNLVLLVALLILAAPEVTFAVFGLELLRNTENFAAFAWKYLGPILHVY